MQHFARANYAGICPEALSARIDANLGHAPADGLGQIPGTRLLLPVESNAAFVELPKSLQVALRQRGWRFHDLIGAGGCRFMCT